MPDAKPVVRSDRAHDAHSDQRMMRIVRVLNDNAMLVVSGPKLGQEIGATRGEVWRLVQHLRSLGVDIAGHPATGYRLEAVPDLLLPDAISPLVSGTIFASHIHHFFKTQSTNTAAMQAAAAGEPEGAVFLAEEQVSGKGRAGHSWHSAPSTGIYCSVILRPRLSPAEVLPLALMTGLATAAAVEEVTGQKPDLRWPNDLLLTRAIVAPPSSAADPAEVAPVPSPSAPSISDPAAATGHSPVPTQSSSCPSPLTRKFCGILTELNAEATIVRHVVVGIGINVNQEAFPPEIADIATSLRIEGGRFYSRVELTGALLRHLDREYVAFKAADPQYGRAAILRRFEQRSSYARGLRVRVEEEGGYEGTTDGLDERGFLRVRTEKGVRTVIHGGVRALTDADVEHF
jgi:BirA family biotin operon repressor/biotin-[acetyl-CoA-carboxylase] ligase